MTSIDLTATSFAYIHCDIPEGQTLVEWRSELNAARRFERPVRRSFRLPRWGRFPRVPRVPRLRPAWCTS